MDFIVKKIEDVTIIILPGDVLDASNSEELKRDSTPLLEANKKVVFDMAKLRFVDSSGCGALLSCLRKITGAEGSLKLCGVSKLVGDLFKLIRMDRIFEIWGSEEEAVKAFKD